MTYAVNESCIRCKTMDCVDVCPVDCFYEGENMLVIHPDECIDCGSASRETGKTSVFATLILLQTAQKSLGRRRGVCCAGED